MYMTETGSNRIMVSVALSFGETVTPRSSNLMLIIKVMINEVNSVACIVGT